METRNSSYDDHGRRLTLVLSALALPTHLLSAIALQHLPTDPFHLGSSLSLYCIWAAVLSLLGLVGALKRSPTLVTIFSHHLLLDALISTLPRLMLLPAVASIPGTLCAGVENQQYLQTILSSRDAEKVIGFWTADRCRAGLWGLQIVVGLVFVAMTCVQWWCALRVRGYAWFLETKGAERGKRERRVRFADEVVEKSGIIYEEDMIDMSMK